MTYIDAEADRVADDTKLKAVCTDVSADVVDLDAKPGIFLTNKAADIFNCWDCVGCNKDHKVGEKSKKGYKKQE